MLPHVFLAGAVRLEMAHLPGGADQSVAFDIDLGGDAARCAVHLAALGLPVRFVSCAAPGPVTRMIRDALVQQQVTPHIEEDAALPQGGLSRHYDARGQLRSEARLDAQAPWDAAVLEQNLRGALLALVDGEVPEAALRHTLDQANHLGIPVFGLASTPAAARRLAPHAGRMAGLLADEWPENAAPSDADPTPFILRRQGGVLCWPNGHAPRQLSLPAAVAQLPRHRAERFAAILWAFVVFHRFWRGQTLDEAVRRAAGFGPLLLDRTQRGCLEAPPAHAAFDDEKGRLTDRLTGAQGADAIRAALTVELHRFTRNAPEAPGVVLVDVDHFARLNQRQGRPRADAVLADVARLVRAQLRGCDGLGRLEADQFLCVLPATPLEKARQVAERIREAVAAQPLQGLPVSVSCGVAVLGACDTASDLIDRARGACRAAKSSGRNRCVSAP